MTEKQETAVLNSLLKDGEKRPIEEIMIDLQDQRPFFESIIVKALKDPLASSELDEVVALLMISDPKLVYHCGLTPEKLSELVENNPRIAVEVLIKLTNHPEIVNYYMALINMNISRQSLKVVTWLTEAVELPVEFFQMYLSNCVLSCQNIKDTYIQNRIVRLFCVYLKILIRNKRINTEDVLSDIDTTGIHDAAAFSRLINNME